MRIVARAKDLYGEGVVQLKAPEVVHDGEIVVGHIIHAAQTGEPVEAQRGTGVEELCDWPPV